MPRAGHVSGCLRVAPDIKPNTDNCLFLDLIQAIRLQKTPFGIFSGPAEFKAAENILK